MNNPFAGWTVDMVKAHNERVARGRSESRTTVKIQTAKIAQDLARMNAPLSVTKVELKKRELLNKTERLWKAELERRGHKNILVQALTLRLGDRLTYRPDLVTVEQTVKTPAGEFALITAYETKAPHRFATAGVTKIKAAAKQYPFIRFVLVMRDKGRWTEREIGSQ